MWYISSSSSKWGNSIGMSPMLLWFESPLSPRTIFVVVRSCCLRTEAESKPSKSSSGCMEANFSKPANLNHWNLAEPRPSSDKTSAVAEGKLPNWRWSWDVENFCKIDLMDYFMLLKIKWGKCSLKGNALVWQRKLGSLAFRLKTL